MGTGMNMMNIAMTGIQPFAQKPPSPTPLQQLQTQQLNYAQNFRNNLGSTTNQGIYNNNVGINNKLMSNTSAVKRTNAARGMSYGGVNQGQQQGLIAEAQREAATQGGQIQQGLLNEANQFDMNAINTGVEIQNQSQQMQSAIYQNAMANQNASNAEFGSAAGLGLMAYMLA